MSFCRSRSSPSFGDGAEEAVNWCPPYGKWLKCSHKTTLIAFQQAHALTALYTSQPAPKFPFLTLLVSGGHTLLLLARSRSHFTILATTSDESVGNAFDRVAKLLDIPWSNDHSAGASLERFAEQASSPTISFSIPSPGKLAFSYSGLISAVRSHILKRSDPGMVIKLTPLPSNSSMKHPPTPERELARERIRLTVAQMSVDERRNIAASFQKAAIGQLEEKLKLGLKQCMRLGVSPGSVVVSGGVASNSYLRSR
jgi:N6-L-threonylcarbamoyladenine synthase